MKAALLNRLMTSVLHPCVMQQASGSSLLIMLDCRSDIEQQARRSQRIGQTTAPYVVEHPGVEVCQPKLSPPCTNLALSLDEHHQRRIFDIQHSTHIEDHDLRVMNIDHLLDPGCDVLSIDEEEGAFRAQDQQAGYDFIIRMAFRQRSQHI